MNEQPHQPPTHSQHLLLYVLVGLLALLVLGVGGLAYMFGSTRATVGTEPKSIATTQTAVSPGERSSTKVSESKTISPTTEVVWQPTEDGWQAVGTPPACPDPLFISPVDLSRVTAILYPGQTRGGNYKPHGGFRFDTSSTNAVTVTAPLDAEIVNGARYLVDGETQYTFDFIAPCGMMYRLGHLLELPQKLQEVADQFPAAVEGDSRTTFVNPPVAVSRGDVIATAIGVTKDTNVFVDWGVYDLRKKNTASEDVTWAATHDPSLAQRAVCWFDLLSSAEAVHIRQLPPGDPTSGTSSDYCQ